jgi:hypothetical protein
MATKHHTLGTITVGLAARTYRSTGLKRITLVAAGEVTGNVRTVAFALCHRSRRQHTRMR